MRERVLYLATGNPFNPVFGGAQRSYFILRSLLERYDVDLITDDKDVTHVPDEYNNTLRIYTLQNVPKNYLLKRISHWVRNNLNLNEFKKFKIRDIAKAEQIKELIKKNNYKFIVIRYLDLIPYYGLEKVRGLVVDIDDYPEEKMRTTIMMQKGSLDSTDEEFINNRLKLYNKLADKASVTFMPNKSQTNIYTNCHYLPNIPINYDFNGSCTQIDSKKVIFVGVMSADINYLGMDKFISDIWPKVIEKDPDLKLHIIGKHTPIEYRERWEMVPGIVIRGFVENIEEEYQTASLVISPIYNGGGTNLKVLECLAYGRPMVMSKFSARGLEDYLIDGENCEIAINDTDFAEKILRLSQDPELASSIGLNGKSVIQNYFTFDLFKKDFFIAIDSIH